MITGTRENKRFQERPQNVPGTFGEHFRNDFEGKIWRWKRTNFKKPVIASETSNVIQREYQWWLRLGVRNHREKNRRNSRLLWPSLFLNCEKSIIPSWLQNRPANRQNVISRWIQRRSGVGYLYSRSGTMDDVSGKPWCSKIDILKSFLKRSWFVPKSFPERFGNKPGTFWKVLLESLIHTLSICREGIVCVMWLSVGSPLEFLIQSHIQAGRAEYLIFGRR